MVPTTRGTAYPPLWRFIAALLVTVSRTSLLVLVVLLMLSPDLNPLELMRVFSIVCLAPELAAWLITRAFAATVGIDGDTLVLQQLDRRTEMPCSAVARIEPWAIPIPAGGVWLRLQSGRRFRYGLQIPDVISFSEALVDAGAAEQGRLVRQHPMAIYTSAREPRRSRRWLHRFLKFGVFGLVPTLPLFRVHQHIAYGGTFGEYYIYGLKAYLLGFGIYWGTLTINLVLWAAALRVPAEAVALLAAFVAPSRAVKVRRAVEVAHAILYYGGVPFFVILRFVPW